MEEMMEDTFDSIADDDIEEAADEEVANLLYEITKGVWERSNTSLRTPPAHLQSPPASSRHRRAWPCPGRQQPRSGWCLVRSPPKIHNHHPHHPPRTLQPEAEAEAEDEAEADEMMARLEQGLQQLRS